MIRKNNVLNIGIFRLYYFNVFMIFISIEESIFRSK